VNIMKTKRMLLTFSSIALLTLSIAEQGFAATAPFTDLTNVAAKDKILVLQQMGALRGVENNHFLPDATITAAQGIQLIVGALDLNLDRIRFIKQPLATDYFAKADNKGWYANALIIAVHNGFDLPADLEPNQLWTKEEFIHQLMLALELHSNLPKIKITPVEFDDMDELNPLYQGSIQRAITHGIAKLDKDQLLHPKDGITRKEAAEIIYQALAFIKALPDQAEDTPVQ